MRIVLRSVLKFGINCVLKLKCKDCVWNNEEISEMMFKSDDDFRLIMISRVEQQCDKVA
ncbi:hypothetical protein KIN20_014120 [Parelaphostrongylus tenuis]|uniref:Uncharacterized protein n=1 Tax=Parelaphostrongylus tenuis TaxID=148309 RepID=A0AAD5QP70_PARTN|nr:hypothetical protein KIN20_014120 [Parelaphostrongylus tenuis]